MGFCHEKRTPSVSVVTEVPKDLCHRNVMHALVFKYNMKGGG